FLAGAVLLGVTYLLVKQAIEEPAKTAGVQIMPPKEATLPRDAGAPGPTGSAAAGSTSTDPATAKWALLPNGQTGTLDEANKWIKNQQNQARNDLLNSLLTRGGVALLGVGVVAIGFGWLMAERAMRPLNSITATARRVAAGASAQRGLHERIALTGPRDEIRELSDTFDDMLERLDRSFDGQRRFVANASHELRTPLAINRALVEVAITRPDASPDAQRLGEPLLAVNARHERLIDGLLTLADSGNEVLERSTVDLRDAVTHVLDQCAANGLTVRRELAPAPVQADPVLLER